MTSDLVIEVVAPGRPGTPAQLGSARRRRRSRAATMVWLSSGLRGPRKRRSACVLGLWVSRLPAGRTFGRWVLASARIRAITDVVITATPLAWVAVGCGGEGRGIDEEAVAWLRVGCRRGRSGRVLADARGEPGSHQLHPRRRRDRRERHAHRLRPPVVEPPRRRIDHPWGSMPAWSARVAARA